MHVRLRVHETGPVAETRVHISMNPFEEADAFFESIFDQNKPLDLSELNISLQQEEEDYSSLGYYDESLFDFISQDMATTETLMQDIIETVKTNSVEIEPPEETLPVPISRWRPVLTSQNQGPPRLAEIPINVFDNNNVNRPFLFAVPEAALSTMSSGDFEDIVFQYYVPINGNRNCMTKRMFKLARNIEMTPSKYSLTQEQIVQVTDKIYDIIPDISERRWIERKTVKDMVALAAIFRNAEACTDAAWVLPPTRGKLEVYSNSKYLNYVIDFLDTTLSKNYKTVCDTMFGDKGDLDRTVVDVDFGHLFPSLLWAVYLKADLYLCVSRLKEDDQPYYYQQCLEILTCLDCVHLARSMLKKVRFVDYAPVRDLEIEYNNPQISTCVGITKYETLQMFKAADYFMATRITNLQNRPYGLNFPVQALGLAFSNLSMKETLSPKILLDHNKDLIGLADEDEQALKRINRVQIQQTTRDVVKGTFQVVNSGLEGLIIGIRNGNGAVWCFVPTQ